MVILFDIPSTTVIAMVAFALGLSIFADGKNWRPCRSRAFSRRMLFVCFVAASAVQGASALPLDNVEKVYTQKLEKLGSYAVEYQVESFSGEGEAGSTRKRNRLLVGAQLQFRLESAAVPDGPAQSQFRQLMTADQHELRALNFLPSGIPDSGMKRLTEDSIPRFEVLCFTPAGLAGLCDSSSFFTPGADGLHPFMADIRALSRQPDARLVANPVTLNDVPAYILEWPVDAPHPSYRAWLSADDDLNLLQFETYMADASGAYSMILRTTNSDFHEVVPGVSLPKSSTFYRSPSTGVESQDMTLSAITYTFDVDPSAEDFRLTFPDGIRIRDGASPDGPVSSAWQEFKNDVADVAESLLPSRQGSTAHSGTAGSIFTIEVFGISIAWILLALIIALAFALWLGVTMIRRWFRETPLPNE